MYSYCVQTLSFCLPPFSAFYTIYFARGLNDVGDGLVRVLVPKIFAISSKQENLIYFDICTLFKHPSSIKLKYNEKQHFDKLFTGQPNYPCMQFFNMNKERGRKTLLFNMKMLYSRQY